MAGKAGRTLALSMEGETLYWVAADLDKEGGRILGHGTETLRTEELENSLASACRAIAAKVKSCRRFIWVVTRPELRVDCFPVPQGGSPDDLQGIVRSESEKRGVDLRTVWWGTRILWTESRKGAPWVGVLMASITQEDINPILRGLRQGGISKPLLVPAHDLLERSGVGLVSKDRIEAVAYAGEHFTWILAFDGRKATYATTLPPMTTGLNDFMLLLRDYLYRHEGRGIEKLWVLQTHKSENLWMREIPVLANLIPRPAYWLLTEAALQASLLTMSPPVPAEEAGAAARRRTRTGLLGAAAVLAAGFLAWKLFMPPPPAPPPPSPQPQEQPTPAPVQPSPPERPPAQLPLPVYAGLMEMQGERYALLSKRWVKVGDVLDDRTVREITPERVVLEKPKEGRIMVPREKPSR